MFEKIGRWYWKYERPISSLGLIGGFIFEALTLTRVDLFLENFWIILHLLTVAILIIILNLNEKIGKSNNSKKIHFWLILFIQFTFGGLLSTFLVFYFRSATLSASWPFLLLLGLVFAGNEIFRDHYHRLAFQVSVLFLSVFSFDIYFIPVVTHQIGENIFILSGLVSLVAIATFLMILRLVVREKYKSSRTLVSSSVIILYFVINILYFTNVIPPLPLSLKFAGIYHSISKASTGDYVVSTESQNTNTSLLSFFNGNQVYHWVPGDTIYFYSAVFSPTNFATNIIHDWQFYDSNKNKWVSEEKIVLPIVGGRDGGYRTYSDRTAVFPGLWRVEVETSSGQHLGLVRFEIESTTTEPTLIQETI